MDLGALLQSSPHAVLVVDPEGRLVWGNRAAVQILFGRAEEGVPGEDLLSRLAGRHRPKAARLLQEVAAGTRGGPVYLRLAGPDERWIAVRGAPAEDGHAQLAVVEVTEAVLARRRVRESERRFRAAFEAGVTGQLVLDADDRVVHVNDALAAIVGRTREQLVGSLPESLLHEDDVALLRRGSVVRRAPLRLRAATGEVRHVLVTTTALVEGDAPLLFVQVEDVTERIVNEQRLRHLALHDPLTDLPGRPLLLGRLEAALDTAPEQGLVAVLFVDLDGFKLVNDALGHASGDRVLVEAAGRLRGAARRGDTVGRFGGDEFLVVCPGLADRQEGLAVARRIERAVSAPFPFEGDEVLLSASVGVAFSEPGESESAEALVRDADTAMYRAKQLGKRRFEVFDQAMRERAAERGRVEHLLARALTEDRVVVHYQPVVDLVTRRVVGVEALLRVRDDDGSLLQPAAFLDVAQESGLLPALDDVVLDRAVAQVARWRTDLGVDLDVAVNVCAAQVTAELPGKVDAALRASGLPAGGLVLELTEQALVSSAPAAGLALQRLADRGVRLAIDDFGTGWASLTYLRRFPVAIVKIDQSFVAGLPDEQDDCVIVKAVVDLASQLGLSCVAEGVEDEQQYAALRAMEPPYAQGHLFGAAVPPEDVPALLG